MFIPAFANSFFTSICREKDVWKGRDHPGNANNNDRDDLFFKNNAIDSVIDADATQSNLPKKEVRNDLSIDKHAFILNTCLFNCSINLRCA